MDVDLDALASVAARLKIAGEDLDAAGGLAPGAPDAGDFSAVLSTGIAHLAESAGNVVHGLTEAAAHVERARSEYAKQDAATAAHLGSIY